MGASKGGVMIILLWQTCTDFIRRFTRRDPSTNTNVSGSMQEQLGSRKAYKSYSTIRAYGSSSSPLMTSLNIFLSLLDVNMPIHYIHTTHRYHFQIPLLRSVDMLIAWPSWKSYSILRNIRKPIIISRSCTGDSRILSQYPPLQDLQDVNGRMQLA